ncbi:MAG TPA: hypothetical protein ENG69_05965 [Candidatus Korarchaeota archaeon]|nr:hypothetical protein [Candidatus Korarchaeota archaeon]
MYGLHVAGIFRREVTAVSLSESGLTSSEVATADRELRAFVSYWAYAALSDSGMLREVEGNLRRRLRRSSGNPDLLDAVIETLIDARVLTQYDDMLIFESPPEKPTITLGWLQRALLAIKEEFSKLPEILRRGSASRPALIALLALYDNPIARLEASLSIHGFGLEKMSGTILVPWSGMGILAAELREKTKLKVVTAAPANLARIVRLVLRTMRIYEGASLSVVNASLEEAGLEALRSGEVGEGADAGLLANALQWARDPRLVIRSTIAGLKSKAPLFILQTIRSPRTHPATIVGSVLGASVPPTRDELEEMLSETGLSWRYVGATRDCVAIVATMGGM